MISKTSKKIIAGLACCAGLAVAGFQPVHAADSVQPAQTVKKAGFERRGGKSYYRDASGQLLKGEHKLGRYWYFFNQKNGQLVHGWHQGKYYGWHGHRVSGEKKIGRYWYYFNPQTGLMQKGFQTVSRHKRYYSKKTGRKLFGLRKISGRYYYLTKGQGNVIYNRKKIAGVWYYFSAKTGGASVKDTRKSHKVQSYINHLPKNVHVYYRGLTNANFGTASHYGYSRNIYDASVGKMPIVMYTQYRINKGQLKLSTRYRYTLKAIYNHPYSMGPGGTGTIQFDRPKHKTYSVQDLLTRTIKHSDNQAYSLLFYYVVRPHMKDFKNYIHSVYGDRKFSLYHSPYQTTLMMNHVHHQKGIARDVLANTDWKHRKIGEIPVRVEHKIGICPPVSNDTAWVGGKHPFLLAIYTTRNGRAYSDHYIGKIARHIYQIAK